MGYSAPRSTDQGGALLRLLLALTAVAAAVYLLLGPRLLTVGGTAGPGRRFQQVVRVALFLLAVYLAFSLVRYVVAPLLALLIGGG
jgi:hypothetical protein